MAVRQSVSFFVLLAGLLLAATLRADVPGASVLYTFVGTDGAEVTTVANLGSGGEAFNGTASAAVGASVTYSDDVPAACLYSDLSATTPLSTDWKSVNFAVNGSGHGGVIEALGLGEHLCAAAVSDGFTIEFFMKFEEAQNWKDFLKFWYRSETLVNQQAKYVLWGSAAGLQMTPANPTKTSSLAPGIWYHLAAVYTPTDSTWRMYINGTPFAEQVGEIKGAGTGTRLKIGGDGTTSENFAGKLAAFRVTPAALATDKFLRARRTTTAVGKPGVMGFWAFEEGAPGDEVKSCPNDQVDPFEALLGLSLGTGGSFPTLSDDVPGSVIFESVTNLTPIAMSAQSVKFHGSSDGKAGSGLVYGSLGAKLAAAGAFTLEFFGKIDETYTWRNFFATTLRSSPYLGLKLADRSMTEIATQVGAENFAGLGFVMNGSWHHYALTWDGATKVLETFVDHQRVKTVENVEFTAASGSGYFGCHGSGGSGESLNGKLFGIRISSRVLDPLDMLATGRPPIDTESAKKTVFHWDFEDVGATEGGEIVVTAARPLFNGFLNGYGQSSGSRRPTYSDAVAAPEKPYTVQGKEVVATNRFSARFWGYTDANNNKWAGSRLENLRARATEDETLADEILRTRPASFTFECFLRRDMSDGVRHDGTNGEMLAGYGARTTDSQAENTDWYMFFLSDTHSLRLNYWSDEDQPNHRFHDLSDVKLKDGEWHHLALTYDDANHVFKVYADRVLKLEWDVSEKPMRRTLDKGWRHAVGRGFNASGFNGWMDDIRLTDGVLSPKEFLRKGAGESELVIFIR